MMGRVTAVIPAAGRGRRMRVAATGSQPGVAAAAEPSKLWLYLGNEPIILRTLQAFEASPVVDDVVIVAGSDEVDVLQGLVESWGLSKVRRVVPGGRERQASVARGLAAVDEACDVVVVHDAARPLVSEESITDVVVAARRMGAAAVGVRVKDTIKQVDENGSVMATLDRATLWQVQTPQAFRVEVLREAHVNAHQAGVTATDDAALVERMGRPVQMVEGSYANIKITTPEDLLVAEAMDKPQARGEGTPGSHLRIGYGYDVHRVASGRRLILGGVEVPWDKGLLGHSDADVLLHAITDALLGAAGEGDIGLHFPDTDPRYQDADSLVFLQAARDMVANQGLRVGNVDATIVAQEPRLAPFTASMQARIAQVLGISPGAVNVKATTSEGLGFLGAGEGIAAHAVALLLPD